jgi:hypothetical protein
MLAGSLGKTEYEAWLSAAIMIISQEAREEVLAKYPTAQSEFKFGENQGFFINAGNHIELALCSKNATFSWIRAAEEMKEIFNSVDAKNATT